MINKNAWTARIMDAKENGLSIRKIADEVGINRGAVQRFLQVA